MGGNGNRIGSAAALSATLYPMYPGESQVKSVYIIPVSPVFHFQNRQ